MSRAPGSLLLLAALVGSSCGPCRRESLPITYDLAALAPVADADGPWTLLRPATVAGRRAFASGLDAAPPEVAGGLLRRHSTLRLTFEAAAPRVLALDLEPLGARRLGIRLNGPRVARVELGPGRRTYAIDLPAGGQVAGANTLDLHFDDADEQVAEAPRQAARVYGVGVARDVTAATVTAEPIFEVKDAVVTAPPVGLTFGLTAGAGSELRFGVDASAGGTARAEWTPDGAPGRELWSRELQAGQAVAEQAVDLPAGTGRLRLSFTGREPGLARVRWRSPRVTGSEPPPALLAPPPSPSPGGPASAPLVLVVLDAARAQQFGAYGYRRPTSPRIDDIAREGLLVENAYTTAVFTLSAMSSLWTSLPPELHHAGVPYDGPLPPDHLTLAELLGAAGYRTAGFVGNARAGAAYGMERGFAHWVESRQQSVGAGATELVDAARAWIREQPDDRFFLYVHLREPHFPYAPPAPWDALFPGPSPLPPGALQDPAWYRAVNAARSLGTDQQDALVRAYDRNLAFADAKTGEIVDELRAGGRWERALAVVTSDHGEALGEHTFISHNEQVYEESTRIPLIVKMPGTGSRGLRHPGLATTLDVAPTFAEAAGVSGRAGSFRGHSLLSLARGGSGSAAAVSRAAGEESLYGVRYGSWKCVVDTRWGGEELYDLTADPGEKQEVSAARPGRMAECRQALHRHLLELRPPRPSTLRERALDPAQIENLRALGYVQ